MVWKISYLPDQKCVVVHTKGDIAYRDLPKQFEAARRLAQEADTYNFLFEDTEIHMDVSMVDIYELPKLLISWAFPGRVKLPC